LDDNSEGVEEEQKKIKINVARREIIFLI